MAATVVNLKYGRGAVNGSLAYSFDNPELYREEYSTAPTPTARPETQTRVRVRTRARTAVRTRQSLAPTSMLGVLVAAFLFVTAIMAQSQLVALSSESVKLQNELTMLEEDQAKLRISYESAFNMSEIENYAVRSLGMQRPSADQICYIDTSAPDRAVVVAGAANGGLVDQVSELLSGFGAYLN